VTFVRWLGSELLLLLPSAHPEKNSQMMRRIPEK
tara:strand:- start:310 stop:411 length:102 start_codon:yes stop_codon:yes gene_type:complete